MSHRLELLEESAEAVALGLDVLRGAAHGRGGRGETADIGKRAGASAHTRHAEPPLLGLGFNGGFSRVVGAGREGLGLLGDLRLESQFLEMQIQQVDLTKLTFALRCPFLKEFKIQKLDQKYTKIIF